MKGAHWRNKTFAKWHRGAWKTTWDLLRSKPGYVTSLAVVVANEIWVILPLAFKLEAVNGDSIFQ